MEDTHAETRAASRRRRPETALARHWLFRDVSAPAGQMEGPRRGGFPAPMPININSKKPWHPSRHETQDKIRRFREAECRRKTVSREERIRILAAEDEENTECLYVDVPGDYRF